jgi:hypothetical protein
VFARAPAALVRFRPTPDAAEMAGVGPCLVEPGHSELKALLRAPAAEVALRRTWSRRPDRRAAAKARGVEAGTGRNQVEGAGANGCRGTRAGHTADPEARNRPELSSGQRPRLRMNTPAWRKHVGHPRTPRSRPGEQGGQNDGRRHHRDGHPEAARAGWVITDHRSTQLFTPPTNGQSRRRSARKKPSKPPACQA